MAHLVSGWAMLSPGDRVYLNAPNSPSNGMPGTIQEVRPWPCGTLHYYIKFDNGTSQWLTKEFLK